MYVEPPLQSFGALMAALFRRTGSVYPEGVAIELLTYAFEPAMTTWKSLFHWPSLVAESDLIGAP
jgi:hypothetical protein